MCLVINSSWIWFLWEETIQINWLYSSLFYRLWHAKVWRCVTLFGCGKCRTFGCERSFRFKFKSTKFFEVCTEFRPQLDISNLGVLEIKVWVGVRSATYQNTNVLVVRTKSGDGLCVRYGNTGCGVFKRGVQN